MSKEQDSNKPVKKRRGRPPGQPRSPMSGRQKGTVNQATMLKNGICKELNKAPDYLKIPNDEKLKILMDSLWQQAVFKNSIFAYKTWYDIYSTLGSVQALGGYKFVQAMDSIESVDTFEDMNMCAEHIMKLVFRNQIAPGAATLLMNLLKDRRYFKEAALEPILSELIQVEESKKCNVR